MPLNNSNFDRLINSLNSLNETELEAFAEVCQARVEGKRKARREALRQELMENLQKAIGDILRHKFHLKIENISDPEWMIQFNPNETYRIEIK